VVAKNNRIENDNEQTPINDYVGMDASKSRIVREGLFGMVKSRIEDRYICRVHVPLLHQRTSILRG